jgi:hypothetical protein
MKTLIKLVIVAAVLLATYHVGDAYWDHYQFEDAIKEAAQVAQHADAQELTAKVLNLAEKMEIPLDPENLSVTREQRRITIDAVYVRSIELLPRVTRHWEFTIHISVLALN